MRSESVNKFLLKKGYKCESPHGGDPDFVVSNYYRTPYEIESLPFCACNDKPPQLHVRESYLDFGRSGDQPYHSFSVGIRNEAPQGWLDFKFYGLNEEDVLQRFDELQAALLASWRSLFSVVTNKEK